MKRDMDVIRRIALATEALPPGQVLRDLKDLDNETFAIHVQWMEEAGLLTAAIHPKDGVKPADMAVVWRLTWAGCEIAEAVRNDTLWAKAKKQVIAPSSSWTFGVLTDWLKTEILNGLSKIAGS
jgi:DNA-binding HxlR family transcriptional regulator